MHLVASINTIVASINIIFNVYNYKNKSYIIYYHLYTNNNNYNYYY